MSTETDHQADTYWNRLIARTKQAEKIATAAVLALSLAPNAGLSQAEAANCCNPNSYYNWAQVHRQNLAARQRGIEHQQQLCHNLKASGRAVLWTGCR
jgi:hypothetical protein